MSRKNFIFMLLALFLFVGAAMEASAQVPDEIRRVIEDKARERDLGGLASLGFAEVTSRPSGRHVWAGYYVRGTVYVIQPYGAAALTSAVASAYYDQFRESIGHAPIGLPISDEIRCRTPDTRDRYQLFERGVFFWRASQNSWIGYPNLPHPRTTGNCAIPGPTATVVTQPEPATGERFRVSIIGFTANRQTSDDPMQSDGKGDEVYLVAQVAKFQSNGQLASNTFERSVLMGDTNQRPASEERMTVGGASADGGIRDGDSYMPANASRPRYSHPALPWIVYEGALAPGSNAVMIIPTIWEWDGDERQLQEYRRLYFSGPNPQYFYGREPLRRWGDNDIATNGQPNPWVTNLVRDSLNSPTGFTTSRGWGTGPVINFTGNSVGLFREGDQPIGLSNAPASQARLNARLFSPQILFLTYRLAQTVVTRQFPVPAVRSTNGNTGTIVEPFATLGPGVIPIRYAGSDEGTGDYTIFLRVERIP